MHHYNYSETQIDKDLIKSIKDQTSGNTGFKIPSEEEIVTITDVIKKIYLDHQLFPKDDGSYNTYEDIRLSCLKEVL
jgi:hypothetical protein